MFEHVDVAARLSARGFTLGGLDSVGAWPPLGSAFVGIVGSRRASREALQLAHGFGRRLADAGVVVVSGGALGIDGASHAGCVEARGRSVVVLPTGVADPVPRSHHALFSRVLDAGGAWVAERTLTTGRWSFVRRNKLLAALLDYLLVVEADEPSGTRATVVAARAFGVPVGVVPWSPLLGRARGCHRLLREGAQPVIDATDVLGAVRHATPAGGGLAPRAHGLAGAIVEALAQEGPLDLDALARATALDRAALLSTLGELELDGLVEPVPGGRFAPTRRPG